MITLYFIEAKVSIGSQPYWAASAEAGANPNKKKAPTRVCRSLFKGALIVDPITDVAELSGSVLAVASQVFDRLAVLRQGTRYQQGHLGAQLGDLTNGVLYALFKPQGAL